jgi:hypothetical protein
MKSRIRFEAIEEVVHHFGVRRHNFNVLHIVVTVSALDLIENAEAVFQLLIKHHVMDRLFHFADFCLQLVFLFTCELIVVIAALGQVYLEINFCLL